MRDDVLTRGCERARTWGSLALDGELSELEQRLLDVHLARCASCASFVTEMEELVAELRAAPTEPFAGLPPSGSWSRRPAVPAMRVVSRAAAVAAAAAAGIAMFSLGAGSVGEREPVLVPQPIILDVSTAGDTMKEVAAFREIRRAQLLSGRGPGGSRSGQHPGTSPL